MLNLTQFKAEDKGDPTFLIIVAAQKETETKIKVLSERDQTLLSINDFLAIYYALWLLTFGTVFNVLSIYVLSQPVFKNKSTSLYLRFLACADMVTLYSGMVSLVIQSVSGYDIRTLSKGFCMFSVYVSSTAPDISAWTLVVVTSERVLAIWKPFDVKAVCSKKNGYIVLATMSLTMMVANFPLAIIPSLSMVDETYKDTTMANCVPRTSAYDITLVNLWNWFDLVKFVLLPSILLLSLNTVIIVLLCNPQKRKAHLTWKLKRKSTAQSTLTLRRAPRIDMSNNNSESNVQMSCFKRSKQTSLILTLVGVNATFILCNTPAMVFLIDEDTWYSPGSPAQKLAATATLLAMYTNNAVNFLLYILTGSKFRKELFKLLSSWSEGGIFTTSTYDSKGLSFFFTTSPFSLSMLNYHFKWDREDTTSSVT